MNAHAHEFDLARATMLPPAGEDAATPDAVDDLRERWLALHEAAHAIAQLAQLGREEMDDNCAALPERAHMIGGPRLDAIERGIGDLTLVMRTGLTALLGASSRGKDASAPALTLWLEFHAGRKAILSIVQPDMETAQ